MIPSHTIARKREGAELSAEEIGEFMRGYVRGEIPDFQMAAMAMAICWRGMSVAETAALTDQMVRSGRTLQWTSPRPKVDKHSTGGLGDKVSLVLAPLLACCDLQVPKISGRGLGITGGTLDKLESIPGLRTELTLNEIQRQAQTIGCVICAATQELAPADRQLYRLRHVTATVESIPLITASILSKKLAESLDALVLDVKFGSGAFMATQHDARQLAQMLVEVGRQLGVSTTALLSDMHQPLGRMVGNAVEVNEAVQTLSGAGPADLQTLVIELGTELLLAAAAADSRPAAETQLRQLLTSGAAREKFQQMVRAQGGDLDAPRRVAPASEVTATTTGYVAAIDGRQLGYAIIEMGGGRKSLADPIDHSVGLEMLVRIGDPAQHGQPLVRLFAPPTQAAQVSLSVRNAIVIQDHSPSPLPLVCGRVPESSP